MIKRTLLSINFSKEENKLISDELKKIEVKVNITPASIESLKSTDTNYSSVGLVLVKLDQELSSNKELLELVKKEFFHFPIILISNTELNTKEYKQYDIKNIIDIRPFNPVFLIAKTIGREITSQDNKYSYHQVKSEYKNESYRFDSFLKHTEDGVALIHNGQYWSNNAAYKRIFNIPEEEYIINTPVLEFSMPSTCHLDDGLPAKNLNTSLESLPDETVLSVLIRTRDNDSFVTTIYKTHCFVKNQLCTQILIHNPDAWSNVGKGFTDLRTFDYESGLYNKRFALEYIDNELEAKKPHGSLALILIDDFRQIRDEYSVNYVDNIIRSVAEIINLHSAKTDILARYSDSVFSLFSCTLSRSEFLINCQEYRTEISNELFGNDSQYLKLSISIGVSFIDAKVTTSKQLISNANKACDKAITYGGNQIHVFDTITTPLTVVIDERKNTELITSALKENRLHPLYQPIVDLSEKHTENYAVLLRILDQNNTHIPPDNFILTAEKTGLISSLDEWVLKNTIEQIRESSRQGIKRRFFISLSSITYRTTTFMETLVSEIKFYNIDTSLLVFQINFTDVTTDSVSLKNFMKVAKDDCGCQLAFDQIGFHQITDEILKEYPVNYLKIDGTFSQNLLHNKESQDIIKSIIKVTRAHNVKTIAKSVENANTLALLWNIGIDAVQGYFLQKPADTMRFDFDLNN